jgi:hypothetical protein
MTNKIQLLVIGVIVLFASSAFGQANYIELKFESERKTIATRNAIIVFHTIAGSYVAKMEKNRVRVPAEAANAESLDIQVLWDNLSVIFTEVENEYLKGPWTVGVDKGPNIDESLVSTVNKGKEIVIL